MDTVENHLATLNALITGVTVVALSNAVLQQLAAGLLPPLL